MINGGISKWGMPRLEEWSEVVGSTGRILAFEPDPVAYSALLEMDWVAKGLTNVEIYNVGLYSTSSTQHFMVAGGASRGVGEPHAGIAVCRFIDLDTFVAENNIPKVNVVKLDIEGSEVPFLHGAAASLRKWKPKLMLSAYHNGRHNLVSIPKVLLEIVPEHQLHFAAGFMHTGELLYYATFPNPNDGGSGRAIISAALKGVLRRFCGQSHKP